MPRPARMDRLLAIAARSRLPVRRAVILAALLVLGAAVAFYKATFVSGDIYFLIYGALGGAYIVSRFALALCYRVPKDGGIEPRIALVMPAFNEQHAIARSLRSLLAVDYPAD